MLQRGSHSGPKAQTAIRRSGKREVTPTASATRFVGRPVRLHSGGTRLVHLVSLCSMCSGGSMAERAAVNRLTKVRFLPGARLRVLPARQDASSNLSLVSTVPMVGRRFSGDMWVRVPPGLSIL